MPFEKDEWESWREHPLTIWFMDFLAKEANEAKNAYIEHVWGQKQVDPILHAAIFERHKVLNEITALTYEDIEEI